MSKLRTIEIKQNIDALLDVKAEEIKQRLKKQGTLFINLMSSPGSGKTTLLTSLINNLKDELKIKEMDVDIYSSKDAETIVNKCGIECLQINNGGLCHIDSDMVSRALDSFNVDNIDLLILENIGNLVCPAEFDTGAHLNFMILSIPEGDDKPLKYPLMFQNSDVVIFSKIDTIKYFDFDFNKAKDAIIKLNPSVKFFSVSSKTNEGIDDLINYIKLKIKEIKND